MAQHNETGELGEDIACKFLVQRGFEVIERNYWRKWGEIDIVALRRAQGKHEQDVVHFVEVKSTQRAYVACENNAKGCTGNVEQDSWRPEEMVHGKKIQRLRRVISTYIEQYDVDEWVFDVVVVYLDKVKRTAKCRYIKDIVL